MLLIAVCLLCAAAAQAQYKSGCSTGPDDPTGFVMITEAIPDAILEIRYHTTYNFVGARIDGYKEPVALMTREAATALKKASDMLKEQGYRIKVYDAYRPQCAVSNFVRGFRL